MTTVLTVMIIMVQASCSSKEEMETSSANKGEYAVTEIEATIDQNLDDTKTIRNDDGTIWWRPGDQISLFFGENMAKFTSTNDENAATVQFTGRLTCAVGGGEGVGAGCYFYGLYPYDRDAFIDEYGCIVTTVPYIQQAITGTFPQDAFVTAGHSENTALSFYNLCGGFKFKLTHAGVKQIEISGHTYETVAGTVGIAFDGNIPEVAEVYEGADKIILTAPEEEGEFVVGEWYMAILLPTVFPNGLDFTFICDNEIGVYNRAAATTISRSKFGTFKAIDSGVVYEQIVPDLSEETGDDELD